MNKKPPHPHTPPHPAAAPSRAVSAGRIAVGLVLLSAGLYKASSPPEEFAAVLEAYYILPPEQTVTAASVMPWVEILVGLSMALGFKSRRAAAAGALLFAVFIGALASVLLRGIPLTDCGCFGWGLRLDPKHTILLDSVLLCLAALAFRKGGGLAPLDTWIDQGS
ncbi:MAG TPA: DoxX family protein [Elusimicrobia bacterium]|nr:DoxX family protein [Elusimicrobiota bacterium]